MSQAPAWIQKQIKDSDYSIWVPDDIICCIVFVFILYYFYISWLLILDWFGLLQDGGPYVRKREPPCLCLQCTGRNSISNPQPRLGSGIDADLKEAPLRLQYPHLTTPSFRVL